MEAQPLVQRARAMMGVQSCESRLGGTYTTAFKGSGRGFACLGIEAEAVLVHT